jgi:DNA polymerase-1
MLRHKGGDRYGELERSYQAAFEELEYELGRDQEPPDYHPSLGIHFGGDLVVDTETYGGVDPREAKMVAISTAKDVRGEIHVGAALNPPDYLPKVLPLADSLTGHNFIWDYIVLRKHGMGRPKIPLHCTMVMAWMGGEPWLALKDLMRKHLGVPTLSYEETSRLGGWDRWRNYAAQDAVGAHRLKPILMNNLSHQEQWVYNEIESPLIPILGEATLKGFRVDKEKINALGDELDSKLKALRGRLQQWGEFNPNSPDQKKAKLQEVTGVTIPDARRDTLLGLLSRHPHPLINLLLAYSKAHKAESTYVRKFRQLDSVSTLYNMCGTRTGRVSCDTPNLQNLPWYIAECLMAPEGMTLVMADYGQLEVRIMAYLSEDKNMIRYLIEGGDMHGDLCKRVWGVMTPELRRQAKMAIFEWFYGGGAETTAGLLNCTLGTARRIQATLRAMYPGVVRFMEKMKRQAHADGYVETIYGRRRYLHDLNSGDKGLRAKAEREAGNSPIQGSGGDFTKLGMVLADDPITQLGGWVAHQVHDSIIAPVPTPHVQDTKEALITTMTEAVPQDMRDVVPVVVDVKTSTHWI